MWFYCFTCNVQCTLVVLRCFCSLTCSERLVPRDWHGCVIPSTRPGIPGPGRGQGTFSHQQTREISAMALQGLARPTLASKDPRSGDCSGIHWSFLTRAAESRQGITRSDSLTDPADRGKDKVSGSPFWPALERSGKILSEMANA